MPVTRLPHPARSRRLGLAAIALSAGCLLAPSAQALPSFARQTGLECATCHVGGFGPQLTAFGRSFKLNGYTQSNGASGHLPVAAMLVESYTHTRADQAGGAGPHDGSNDNFSTQEASLFLAGRLSEHAGAFAQLTYSDIDRKTTLDNVDLRYAKPVTIGSHSGVFGVDVNNNPGVQDVWNSLPAWRFPYMASELAPGPSGSPLLSGGLEHQVLGAGVYTFLDGKYYGEIGFYRSLSAGLLDSINVGDDAGRLSGLTPYYRFNYTCNCAGGSMSFGLVGLDADLHPGRASGPSDKYRDIGVDSSYLYQLSADDVLTINGSFIHEHQRLAASVAAGDAERNSGNLDALALDASWYHASHYGLSASLFDNRGSRDSGLFPPDEPGSGSRTGKPDSSGVTVQADWTPFGHSNSWGAPWANLRLGAQYTAYSRFNGARRDYDGFGRNAADNNTLFLFLWTAL